MSTQDPQWGRPPQNYPPQQGYPSQGYPPQQGYPPAGAQYGSPYPQQQAYYGGQPVAKPRAVKNPLATRALVYGIISFVVFVAIFFTNFIILATWGLYAIYYAIRGLVLATKLPGHKGIVPSVVGLLLSILSLLGTIGVIALNAMLSSGH